MIGAEFDPLFWTRLLVAVALIVQTIELISIRHAFNDDGVWRWVDVRRELDRLPRAIVRIFDVVLSYYSFIFLLYVELVLSVALMFSVHPAVVGFLLLMTIATAVRWRGTFNGGSDYMTVVLLSGLFAASMFPENLGVKLGAVYYIAIVSCLSYFIAGIAKLRSSGWRNGTALPTFLRSGMFAPSNRLERSMQGKLNNRIDSWFIVGYECLFPLGFLNPALCKLFLLLGAGFHLANSYLLGLNRFFFVWIATYPAVLWCSGL